jgi:hypothetical protein
MKMENDFLLTRRKALGLAVAGLSAPFTITQASAATAPVLVELFTSQGCSSCPAADKLAAELKNQPGIMVLSLNVDYWDYLGWRDTLAKKAFTKRQMDYAHARGDMDVYTPQIVINGAAHAVGSNKTACDAAIRTAQKAQSLQLTLAKDEISIVMPNAGEAATLWALNYTPSISVKIERGENAGKTIAYQNVVRHLEKLASWDGKAAALKVPRKGILVENSVNTILLLQKGVVGPVLGFSKLA